MNTRWSVTNVLVLVVAALLAACDTVPIGRDQGDAAATPDLAMGAADGNQQDSTAAPASTCSVDLDCELFRDYCPATCGRCLVVRAPAPRPSCSPPANVSCVDPCAGQRAVCQAGHCTLR
jgi:predicted small secreted protein